MSSYIEKNLNAKKELKTCSLGVKMVKKTDSKKKSEKEKKFDIFEHVFVPKHRLMTDKEVEEVLKKYNCSLSDLPKIFKNDPGIRNIEGVKEGDVIEITRKSKLAGVVKYYRVVVNE